MNPQVIPQAGWMFSAFTTAIEWLSPLIYASGLGVAVRAFMRCRKWGYLIVALYFVTALFSSLAMPSINRAIRAHRAPDIAEQTQRKINAAVQRAIERVMAEEGHPVIPAQRTVHLPLGPILLVAGLWLVARNEARELRSKSPQATTLAPDS